MTEKPDTVNDERVQAAVERVARVLADAVCLDIDECIGSEDCGCDHAAREALAALRPGDVLPGDGSGRLVVVREDAIAQERARVGRIIMAARMWEIDTDLRSINSRIQSGWDPEKKESPHD